MTTKQQQLLQATDKDLPRLLGEVLQPETARDHDLAGDTSYDRKVDCRICKQTIYDCDHPDNDFGWIPRKPCIPHPIDITDWNVAMKKKDWAVGEVGRIAFVKALLRTMYIELELHEIDFTVVAAMFAIDLKPRNYLQAAALCKLNKLKGKKDE